MALRTNDDFFKKTLKKFSPLFAAAITLEMQMGNNIAIEDAKDQGSNTKDSGLTVSNKDLDTFQKKLETNIEGANRDISKRINNAVLQNISNKGSNEDLAKEIKQIFNEKSSDHFNYKNRYKTIARTESTDILNTSSLNKAKKLKATGKYLSGINDAVQGEDSKEALRLYGEPEQAIPLDEPFEFTSGGKVYSYQHPP